MPMTTAEVAEPQFAQETVPLPRRRGAQPGNQNARKHGFYSSTLSPEQQESLEEAAALKDLQSEIALGPWVLAPGDTALVFSGEPDSIWQQALLALGGKDAPMSFIPEHPSRN